jgi:beta-N-acetylhexosaminidase
VEKAILRIYGAGGTGQIDAQDITSLPFGQLKAFVAGGEVQHDVGTLLREADWVIFAQQDLNPIKGPNSDAVKLFLDHPLSTSYKANLVVLAFNAPYYLDTTEISKLRMYLAAYSKTEPFVEAAVRALFGELVPQGAPPVDVAGTSYDLQRQLSPDPSQVIPLVLVQPAKSPSPQAPVSIRLQAGPVLDHNVHPVPDGTLVTFHAEYEGGTRALSVPATTVRGVAQTTATLEDAGRVYLRVESGNSLESQVVVLSIRALPTATPTPSRTPSPTPSHTPTAIPTPKPTVLLSPTAEPTALPPVPGPIRPADGTDLLLASGSTVLVALGGGLIMERRKSRKGLVVRSILLAVVGGMAGYVLYALRVLRPELWGVLPDAAWIPKAAVAVVAGVFALIPYGLVLRTRAEP